MVKFIKDNGDKECNTDKENIKVEMEYGERVIGKMVKELNDSVLLSVIFSYN
jgi:hypothetical protein